MIEGCYKNSEFTYPSLRKPMENSILFFPIDNFLIFAIINSIK